MPVGATSQTHFERQDVIWTFTLDSGVFAGTEVIEFEVKAEADDPDPALFTGAVTPGVGVATGTISWYLDLAPGSYVYGARRTDVRKQLAQGTLTVLESVNVG